MNSVGNNLGIRIAIGATYARIVRMVLGQGLSPAVGGLAVGFALSAATARLLSTIFPVRYQYDPRLFFVVVPLILLVTVFAAFVSARRAARVDPTVALRCEEARRAGLKTALHLLACQATCFLPGTCSPTVVDAPLYFR